MPLLGLLLAAAAGAQDFRIVQAELDAGGRPRVQVPGNTNSYYILRRGEAVTDVRLPVQVTLGAPGAVTLTDSRRARDATFLRVQRVPVAAPLDSDGDGIDDLYELLRPTFLYPLDATDAPRDFDGDAVSNLEEYLAGTDPAGGFKPTTFMSSPGPNESEVSVNRPTILEFERALKPGTALDTTKIFPQAGGRTLLSRVALSSDRKTATVFYLEPMPGGTRVRVTVRGDALSDEFDQAVDADGDGAAGGTGVIEFETFPNAPVPATAVIGQVFASECR